MYKIVPIEIAGKTVGPGQPPLIVAEMSGNHNQSLERAIQIVEAAAEAGVDAIKLQTYTADSMTLDLETGPFKISDETSPWTGKTLYKLYEEAHTPWQWHEPIFIRARDLGMIAFSTPFDESAVEFLENLDVPCYKIASFENTDIPLVKRVVKTGKPLIISAGMATVSELDETVQVARESGGRDIILLKCTSSYPAAPDDSNLSTIPHMRDLFGCQVGISDHTLGLGAAVASVALGASFIEKHFTLARSDGGVDAAFSMEPEEMRLLVAETKRAWQAMGEVSYGTTDAERKSMMFRRSLYIARDMKAGDTFTPENLRSIRPGFGLPPKYYETILGKQIKKDATTGTPLDWDLVM